MAFREVLEFGRQFVDGLVLSKNSSSQASVNFFEKQMLSELGLNTPTGEVPSSSNSKTKTVEEKQSSCKGSMKEAVDATHQSAYKYQYHSLLALCTDENQKKILRDAVHNSRRLSWKDKTAVIENIKESLGLQGKPSDISTESIQRLQIRHTTAVDHILKNRCKNYASGTIHEALEQIRTCGTSVDLRKSNSLSHVSTYVRSLQTTTPRYASNIQPNAAHLNRNLRLGVIAQGQSGMNSIFDAASLYLTQDESLSTALRLLTYKELQFCSSQVEYYCNASGYDFADLPSQILDDSKYSTPPVLHVLAKTIGRNITLHWGTHAQCEDAYSFGNRDHPEMHLVAIDSKFYPVYNIAKKDCIKIRELSPSSANIHKSGALQESVTRGTNLTEIMNSLSAPCNFCNDFRYPSCTHVTRRHMENLASFRQTLLNSKFGSMTANEFHRNLFASNVRLQDSMVGKVVPLTTNMDHSCLYNAISQCLFGSQEASSAIRRAIAIDFIKNEDHYVKQLSFMKYSADLLRNLRNRICCNTGVQSWGTDEVLLLASKVLSRKIIVYSYQNSYTCTQEYNLNPDQSCHFNPILLICQERNHFVSVVPYDWNDTGFTTVRRNQFWRFQKPEDTVVKSDSNFMRNEIGDACPTNIKVNQTKANLDRDMLVIDEGQQDAVEMLVIDEGQQHDVEMLKVDNTDNIVNVHAEVDSHEARLSIEVTTDLDQGTTASTVQRNVAVTEKGVPEECELTKLKEQDNVAKVTGSVQTGIATTCFADNKLYSETPNTEPTQCIEADNQNLKHAADDADLPCRIKNNSKHNSQNSPGVVRDSVTADLPKCISSDEFDEFLEILQLEAEMMVKNGPTENIERFVKNIMCCEAEFWRTRIKGLDKYQKYSNSNLINKARKYSRFSKNKFAREAVKGVLDSFGCSADVVKSFDTISSQMSNTAEEQRQGKRRQHIMEFVRINKKRKDYKGKTTYQNYIKDNSEVSSATRDVSHGQTEGSLSNREHSVHSVDGSKTESLEYDEGNAATESQETKSEAAFTQQFPDLQGDGNGCEIILDNSINDNTKEQCKVNLNVNDEEKPPESVMSPETLGNQDEKYEKTGVKNDNLTVENDSEVIDAIKDLGHEDKLDYEAPNQFNFEISPEDMTEIFDYETGKFTKQRWPETISSYITRTQKVCSFTATKSVTYYERSSKNGYSRMEGHCPCSMKFQVRIAEAPVRGHPVKCTVVSTGTFNLVQTKKTGRQLRSIARKKKAEVLRHQAAVKVHTKDLSTMGSTPLRLIHNNHHQRSKAVLVTLRAETANKITASTNPREDLRLFAKETKVNDKTSKVLKGFIHNHNELDEEINVHMYTEASLKILASCCKNSNVTLHIDATGSVVKTLGEKHMLLYSIIAQTSKDLSLPVADMLSQRGRAVDIGYFLHKLKHDSKQITTSSALLGQVIVTDFSLAMINGVCYGANGMRLKDYIQNTWNIQMEKATMDPDCSVLFICTNHVIKAASRLMSKHIEHSPANKELRSLAINSVARMQECTDIMSLRRVMEVTCKTFGQKTTTLQELECNKSFLLSKTLEYEVESTDSSSITNEFNVDHIYHKEVTKSSPFYAMFQNVRQKYCSTDIRENQIMNPFYNTKLLDLLHNHYIPYVSLFSAMMLEKTKRSPELRLTNAAVESHFNKVKNYYHDEGKTLYNTFVRRHIDYFKGGVTNVLPQVQNRRANAIKRLQRPISQKVSSHEDSEETWCRRRKRRDPKYVSRARKRNKPRSDTNTPREESNEDLPVPEFDLPHFDMDEFNKWRQDLEELDPKSAEAKRTKDTVNSILLTKAIYDDLKYIEETFAMYQKSKSTQVPDYIELDKKKTKNTNKSPPNMEDRGVPLEELLREYKEVFEKQAECRDPHGATKDTRFGKIQYEGEEHPDQVMTRRDFEIFLQPDNELEDTHIDFYFAMLAKKYPTSNYVLSKSHYAKKIDIKGKNQRNSKYVWNSCQAFDEHVLQSYKTAPLILHPLQKVNHWMLLGIDRDNKTCIVFDSGRSSSPYLQAKTAEELRNEVIPLFATETDLPQTWNVVYDTSFGKQYDVSSCGLFCTAAAEEIVSRNLLLQDFDGGSSALDLDSRPSICQNLIPSEERYKQAIKMLSTTTVGTNLLQECDDETKLRAFFTTQESTTMVASI